MNEYGVKFVDNEKKFTDTFKSEKEILKNSVRNSRVMIFGGIVLSVIGLLGIM